jgi:hypothetical protein
LRFAARDKGSPTISMMADGTLVPGANKWTLTAKGPEQWPSGASGHARSTGIEWSEPSSPAKRGPRSARLRPQRACMSLPCAAGRTVSRGYATPFGTPMTMPGASATAHRRVVVPACLGGGIARCAAIGWSCVRRRTSSGSGVARAGPTVPSPAGDRGHRRIARAVADRASGPTAARASSAAAAECEFPYTNFLD